MQQRNSFQELLQVERQTDRPGVYRETCVLAGSQGRVGTMQVQPEMPVTVIRVADNSSIVLTCRKTSHTLLHRMLIAALWVVTSLWALYRWRNPSREVETSGRSRGWRGARLGPQAVWPQRTYFFHGALFLPSWRYLCPSFTQPSRPLPK